MASELDKNAFRAARDTCAQTVSRDEAEKIIRAYLASLASCRQVEWRPISADDETLCYILRYGADCRDCADEYGVCPTRGLPCEPKDAKRAIRHVLSALNYGYTHGYLPLPAASAGGTDNG